MIESIRVVGAEGRVGSTVSARLAERGVRLDGDAPDLVLLCVPDRAIAEVSAEIELGPWVAHVSGATPLSALEPHERRFGMHPLQSFSKTRGPEQLDGAWAAVSAETEEARTVGFRLAEILGLRPFALEAAGRAAYHAGAAVASNYLVTLRHAAGSLLEAAGAPPEALDPLMRGVIENGFELTGPIARGDWETVARHLAAIREHRPELAGEAGVDVVFAPSPVEIYPPGFQTWVEVTELGSILEGEHRPGHFRGVATVVLKLLSIVRPTHAYFGQKDAQQAEVVRRLISDLALDVELRVLPTVRDPDGLALSSRNALLTPEHRRRALALPRALSTRDPAAARAVLAESNGVVVDYVELADFDPPVLAGAIRVGSTRLIDNVPLVEGD